ncbi:hypothetical protein Rvan_3517 [Rhodomicrobium vannielii ATCC 17100]|uniref:Porin domain-containing protein n=1 Tax=Rhodomicrobium vannielii (strain ATCC 17100 / DSM 162 / LMG 4299 / NCIMB 10020 / ATH 3.1.1) TaxID=648757 RepID=E3I448_RHOVT|nr:porin [Rhodomicrobium vannielii]ADP72697.1 hypothetical protein Rvan_3517 [Rhodomicrobium vannielii ATCC 17100]
MTGGIFNKTSAFALVAAAGLMMGGLSFATTSAKAADLGADDLEARVAELEATTVRKGNRKVSLELSGQVNRALVAWDDGKDSDAYVVDNEQSSTRFRMKGTGTISSDLKAGFLIELGVNDSNSANVTQANDDLATEDTTVKIRQANAFFESKTFGRVTLGQGSSATDDLGIINLSGSLSDASQYFNNVYTVRGGGNVTWGTIVNGSNFFDSSRGDFVRYDTPALYGFILSAAWGENDVWDIALRFQKEVSDFRVAAGVGYYYNGEHKDNTDPRAAVASTVKFDKVFGSASILHVPTGLFVNGAASSITKYNTSLGDVDSQAWFVQGGITKRFLDYGATTVYGEYGNYDDAGVGSEYVANSGDYITASDVTRFGFGATQAFDGAGLEVYAQYHHYEADVKVENAAVKLEDWDAVVTGMKLKF